MNLNSIFNHISSSQKVVSLFITPQQLHVSPLYCLMHCFKSLPTTTMPGTRQGKGDHFYLLQYTTDGQHF